MEPISCVEVIDSVGDTVWIPISEYRLYPNNVLLKLKPPYPEPIISDTCNADRITPYKLSNTFKDIINSVADENERQLHELEVILFGRILNIDHILNRRNR